jgi:hypothetical protein
VSCIFRSGRESDSDAEDIEHVEKLRQVKAVLEEVISYYSDIPPHTFYGHVESLFTRWYEGYSVQTIDQVQP